MLHPYVVVMKAMWDKPPARPGKFPDEEIAEVPARRRLRRLALHLEHTDSGAARPRFGRRRVRPIH
jgi:hypothetical protein